MGAGAPLALAMTRGWQSRSTIPASQSILGGPTLRLFRVTPPYFAVDVSPFAGKTSGLRFEFRSYGWDDFSGGHPFYPGQPSATSHVLDDLKFSTALAVPEPATWALLALGGAALCWQHRRRHP